MTAAGEWIRLDQLEIGSNVRVAGGAGLFPAGRIALNWRSKSRLTQAQAAEMAGVSAYTFWRARQGHAIRKGGERLAAALAHHESPENSVARDTLPAKRVAVAIPFEVNPDLGAFLGYLVGDGHISRVKRHLGLTTADEECVEHFAALARELFGVPSGIKWDDGRYRVLVHSETVSDFLIEAIGLTHGPSARDKKVPECILRSPKEVVAPFLRAYFDCDGYAGKHGVILSTASEVMSEQIQLLLLNFGILSRRRAQKDGCWHVHVLGDSAATFQREIGFGLDRKRNALNDHVSQRR
jgi:stage V sporulation protein R